MRPRTPGSIRVFRAFLALSLTLALSACTYTPKFIHTPADFYTKREYQQTVRKEPKTYFKVNDTEICEPQIPKNELIKWRERNRKYLEEKTLRENPLKEKTLKGIYTEADEWIDNHIIVIDKKGVATHRLKSFDPSTQDETPKEKINREKKVKDYKYKERSKKILDGYLKAARKGEAPNGILIYINGGLSETANVVKQAKIQIPCMKEAGYYPVFLIWESGYFDTYQEQVSYVRNGILHDEVKATRFLYVLWDIVSGVLRSPVVGFQALERLFDVVTPKEHMSPDTKMDYFPKTFKCAEETEKTNVWKKNHPTNTLS